MENKNIEQKQLSKEIILEMFDTFFNSNKNYWLKNKTILDFWKELNLKPAELRAIIKQLRMNGLWIIAGNRGYKLTEDKAELENYVSKRYAELKKEMVVFKLMKEKHDYNIVEPKLW